MKAIKIASVVVIFLAIGTVITLLVINRNREYNISTPISSDEMTKWETVKENETVTLILKFDKGKYEYIKKIKITIKEYEIKTGNIFGISTKRVNATVLASKKDMKLFNEADSFTLDKEEVLTKIKGSD